MVTVFRRCMPVNIALFGLAVFSVKLLAAQSMLPLSMVAAEQLALAQEPGVIAAQARSYAAADEGIAAAALPDPELRLGIMNLPFDSYDFAQEAMTQKQLAIRQMFPAAGSRQAKRERARFSSSAFVHQAEARRRYVKRAVRIAWLDVYFWQQAQRLVVENRQLFGHLVKVTRSIYSVGRQNQQDMIRVELELSRLDDRLLDIDEQVRRSRSSIAQWIGDAAAARPLSAALPELSGFEQLSVLESQLLQHPLLLVAEDNISATAADIELARSKFKPNWGVDVTYGQREDDLMGNPRDDFVSAMITLSIPLFTGNRQDRALNAAVHSHSSVQYERDALRRDLLRQVTTAYARWQQLQFRIDLYDSTIIKQSRAQAQSTLRAYQSDTGDFADVMRAYISDLNTQLDFIRLQIERAKAHAELDYLAGNEVEGQSND